MYLHTLIVLLFHHLGCYYSFTHSSVLRSYGAIVIAHHWQHDDVIKWKHFPNKHQIINNSRAESILIKDSLALRDCSKYMSH